MVDLGLIVLCLCFQGILFVWVLVEESCAVMESRVYVEVFRVKNRDSTDMAGYVPATRQADEIICDRCKVHQHKRDGRPGVPCNTCYSVKVCSFLPPEAHFTSERIQRGCGRCQKYGFKSEMPEARQWPHSEIVMAYVAKALPGRCYVENVQ